MLEKIYTICSLIQLKEEKKRLKQEIEQCENYYMLALASLVLFLILGITI